MLTDGTAYKTGEIEDLDNKEWKELLDVGIDMCRRAVPDWYRLSFQTKTMFMLKMANKHGVIKHRHNFQFRVLLMRENKSIASAGSWNKSIWGVMATKHRFLGLPVISLFLLLQAVFCYYHVRNCSTLVKGYYLDFYLQSSSFKELLLPPLYISSQMRPGKGLHPQFTFLSPFGLNMATLVCLLWMFILTLT